MVYKEKNVKGEGGECEVCVREKVCTCEVWESFPECLIPECLL